MLLGGVRASRLAAPARPARGQSLRLLLLHRRPAGLRLLSGEPRQGERRPLLPLHPGPRHPAPVPRRARPGPRPRRDARRAAAQLRCLPRRPAPAEVRRERHGADRARRRAPARGLARQGGVGARDPAPRPHRSRLRLLQPALAGRARRHAGGRHHRQAEDLQERGGDAPEERAAYEALVRCENLDLGPGEGPLPLVTAAVAEPFPPYEDDVRLAAKVLPAWMGIRFKQAEVETWEHHRLEAGAVAVEAVYPDSPAEAAGVQVGDVILGPPGAPFKENQQIREWTMLSKIGEPAPLLVLRGDRELRVTLAPKPYPLQWTTAAGPPKVDAPAPAVTLTAYRGSVPPRLADGNAHLLFFWATYCGPCKASLPEVLPFDPERHTQVIAVTDELREQLDAFFKKFDRPFPETVAMDEYRKAFLAFGVSGTPTFVLLDGAGKVRSYATGYTPEKGLGVAGWSWTKPAPAGG